MASKQPQILNLTLSGMLVVGLFVLLFGGWMFYVPLDSAAMAPGKLVVEGRSKRVQHFEGGIVKAIHVSEGDLVDADQILLELDDTRARASQDLLTGQYLALIAQIDRLETELLQASRISWSDALKNSSDPRRLEFMREQQNLYAARQGQFRERLAIINERISKNSDTIEQLKQQITKVVAQEKLFVSEIAALDKLVKQKLSGRTQLLALQRDLAEVQERKSALISRVEGLKYDNRENRVQLEAQASNYRTEVSEKLAALRLQYTDLEQRLLASEDVLTRTLIRAPIRGQVVNLAVTTVGGIVGSGEDLLELVPQSGRYMVEARVAPVDVDVVSVGQSASIRFSAYSRRYMPAFEGRLITISADRIEDPSLSEEPFYLAQLEIDGASAIAEGVRLQPGMPIEVTIKTEARTLADYLLEPVMRSFDRAFQN